MRQIKSERQIMRTSCNTPAAAKIDMTNEREMDTHERNHMVIVAPPIDLEMSLQFVRLLIEVIKNALYLILDELKTIRGAFPLSLLGALGSQFSELCKSLRNRVA